MKFWTVALPALVAAQTVPGIGGQLQQIAARDPLSTNPIDQVYYNLPAQDIDFINGNLAKLTSFNGSKCDACKNKLRVGRLLIDSQPSKQHLISLLLYKYCLSKNKNSEAKCDNQDFFVTTNSYNKQTPVDDVTLGFDTATSIDFLDNDFIHMLKNFNMLSSLDMEYYCYFKDSSSCPLPATPDISQYDFAAKWPAKQPQHYGEPAYNATNRTRFNVLHISDFHNELRYQLAAEANCTTPLCCLPDAYNSDLVPKGYNFSSVYFAADPQLKNQSHLDYSFYPSAHYDGDDNYVKGDYYDFPASRGSAFNWLPATTFGNYLCDPPETLLNSSLNYIKKTHQAKQFEFSVFTGDIVDHDVAHCDANTTRFAEVRSYSIMKHFLGQIPVYPTLGNHDTFPYGQLAPAQFTGNGTNSTDYHWNDELMAQLWTNNGWLPDTQQLQIKTHYSGFSVETLRGLKVISLNSNCYYQKNLWAYINLEQNPDIFGQWDFLISELVESEARGQRVWIVAHIPSADPDALPIQSKIFALIVERFSPYTIANIFYGHTHRDQFKVLKNGTEPVNMAWVSQSITPLGSSNPSWRYYEVEDQSFNIMNAYNYYTPLNATWTNGGNEPDWLFEYSARDAYDPDQLWPQNAPLNASFWDLYVLQHLNNQLDIAFNDAYQQRLHRLSPYVPSCKNGSVISDNCYNMNWCDASSFTSDDYAECIRGSS